MPSTTSAFIVRMLACLPLVLGIGCTMDPCAMVECADGFVCDNGACVVDPTSGMPEPPALPVGTSCASFVIACYDELAHQSANLICFRPTSRWNRTELTWRLANTLPGIDENGQLAAVRRAFKRWADESTLTFDEAVDGEADITIEFVGADHGDPFPFDGPSDATSNILGHAYFPGSPRPGESLASLWTASPLEAQNGRRGLRPCETASGCHSSAAGHHKADWIACRG